MSKQTYSEQQLDKALQALPADVQPPQSVWQRIEPALAEHPQQPQVNNKAAPSPWWLASAASIALCALLLWSWDIGHEVAPPELSAEIQADSFPGFAQTVQSYEQALASYARQLAYVEGAADTTQWGDIRWQWQVFEQARDSVYDALVQAPESDMLVEQLVFIYQQHLVWAQALSTTINV